MKIGIISDIHGHLAPLEKALALLDRLAVDQIVCAGDVVGEGYEGDAVVKLLQERQIPCVLGNHDEEAFGDQAWFRRQQRQSPDSPNRLLLDSLTVAYVSSLPLTLSFEWAGTSICLAHGTPQSNKEYLWPLSRHKIMPDQPRTSAMTYVKIHLEMDTQIFILGHTHIPMRVVMNGTWFVNPGSVSQNRTDGSGTCGVLSLPDRAFEGFYIESGQSAPIATGSWETM